jgi:hypothetical protein
LLSVLSELALLMPVMTEVLSQLSISLSRLAEIIDLRPPQDGGKPEVPPGERIAWDLDAIARLTGQSRRHLERLRAEGQLPPPTARCKRRLLWDPRVIRDWLSRGGTA